MTSVARPCQENPVPNKTPASSQCSGPNTPRSMNGRRVTTLEASHWPDDVKASRGGPKAEMSAEFDANGIAQKA